MKDRTFVATKIPAMLAHKFVRLDAMDWPKIGGQGLALHSTLMAVVGGSLVAERVQGGITRITLALPPHMAAIA